MYKHTESESDVRFCKNDLFDECLMIYHFCMFCIFIFIFYYLLIWGSAAWAEPFEYTLSFYEHHHTENMALRDITMRSSHRSWTPWAPLWTRTSQSKFRWKTPSQSCGTRGALDASRGRPKRRTKQQKQSTHSKITRNIKNIVLKLGVSMRQG